jgi:hypothetical protein
MTIRDWAVFFATAAGACAALAGRADPLQPLAAFSLESTAAAILALLLGIRSFSITLHTADQDARTTAALKSLLGIFPISPSPAWPRPAPTHRCSWWKYCADPLTTGTAA